MTMGWQEDYKSKLVSAEEAAKLVNSGDMVGFPIWYPPDDIAFALARRSHELRNVKVQAVWTRKYPWMDRGMEESILVNRLTGCVFQHEVDHLDGILINMRGMWITSKSL